MGVLERFIEKRFHTWEKARAEAEAAGSKGFPPPQIITVSRSSGSRGMYLAKKLAEELGYALLTREHIDFIANSEANRERIKASLDDESRERLQIEMKDLRPFPKAVNTYARNLYESVLPMGRLGGVLLVGRGTNYIFGLTRGFHIRVICDRDKRIDNYVKYTSMTRKEAARVIEKSDRERRKFIQILFNAEIDDPHHYDFVINSEFADFKELIPCLAAAYCSKMDTLKQLHSRGLL